MKKRISNLAKQEFVRQMLKYGIVGIVGLAIDMSVYYLLVVKFSVHYPFSFFISSLLYGNMSVGMIDILISHIISNTLAITNNFLLNSYFTFKVTDQKLRRFVSFVSIAAIGVVISTILLTLFIGIMNLDDMVSKALAILIVAAIQFSINKFFTFKQR
jgi:putative flippase GtrA